MNFARFETVGTDIDGHVVIVNPEHVTCICLVSNSGEEPRSMVAMVDGRSFDVAGTPDEVLFRLHNGGRSFEEQRRRVSQWNKTAHPLARMDEPKLGIS